MIRTLRIALPLLSAAMLAACASGVQRMDASGAASTAAPTALADRALNGVTIRLSDEAKKLAIDNAKFDAEALRTTVERALVAQGMVKPGVGQNLEIEVTSFRTRSGFAAIAFGIMAGTDNVEGVVTVTNAGALVKRMKVSASYGLGGLGGGQDQARMSWLYEEFAKHVVAELNGTPAK